MSNSTEIYDDMLLNGISLENADWIEWVDDKVEVKEIKRGWRRNVPDYEKVSDSPEFWNRKPGVEGNKFSVGGGCFARCPFNWQFTKE